MEISRGEVNVKEIIVNSEVGFGERFKYIAGGVKLFKQLEQMEIPSNSQLVCPFNHLFLLKTSKTVSVVLKFKNE
jgi:hypothetical protein